jgi:hypothetical protein
LIIKNIFAIKYRFTPDVVDKMDYKDVLMFLAMENIRGEKQRMDDIKNKHKTSAARRK